METPRIIKAIGRKAAPLAAAATLALGAEACGGDDTETVAPYNTPAATCTEISAATWDKAAAVCWNGQKRTDVELLCGDSSGLDQTACSDLWDSKKNPYNDSGNTCEYVCTK